MSAIDVRLRVPLRFYSRTQQVDRALGIPTAPALVVPARTTLRVVDWFSGGAYALAPDGRHVLIGYDTLRAHGYPPRKRTS